MKPWMVARSRSACLGIVALALAATPAIARADGGVTLTRFKLPNREAVDALNNMGADLAENVIPGEGGTVYVDAVVTPEQLAQYKALGYEPVQTLQDEASAQANKRDRDAALAEQADALANVKAGKDVKSAKGKSLAADKVQAQRADYFENYAGRFLSIEGWTGDGKNASSSGYSGPALTAAWLDSSGTTLGTGNLSAFVDDSVYLYHRGLFRVGNVGDGGTMPATVRVASANGGVDTLPVKQWVSKDGSGQYPNGFMKDFNTHYVDPQEGLAKIRALAAEFPNIARIVDLPNKTAGYQRNSQAVVGTATAYNPMMTSLTSAGSIASADQPKAVIVTSKLVGQAGGNTESIALVNPNASNSPLSVSVSGNDITVSAATDGTGAITSTAKQVVDAINANADAAALVTAALYRTNAGAGVVSPTAKTMLSDFLKAPASYPRGPQQGQMLRIGTHQDGSKTGVFIYCQEHAREWATPLVCLETAERLLRNYGTDPETTKLVDNLDIFIIPTINLDGAAYSMYDYNSQRKNMVNYCGQANNDPTSRNGWGVDLNRNFSIGSYFDGYDGGGANCNGETFSGPFELSEPEARNETWVQSTFTNIKFAMNVHSYGGYFMWPPGAYKAAGRVLLPYPSPGTLDYFQQTADSVLDRIKSYRGTAILPARTGPVADVLYSAAGNSADEAYYAHGIIGYDFEVGADRFTSTTSGTSQSAVNFQPNYATEGHEEGMEFANGNYALLESALDYQNDTTAPTVTPVGPDVSATPFDVTLKSSEAADIYYTTDGSAPTDTSPQYRASHTRGRPDPIHIGGTTTLRWLAKDFKGNVSTGSKTFYIGMQAGSDVGGSVPATLSLSLGGAASFGAFTPGIDKTYTAQTTATVISTAGNTALTVSDPSRMTNGAFSLAEPLQVSFSKSAWTAPASNDVVTIGFSQHIGANDALRTGSYSTTLTFTLSTTNP